ncbi:hypothetical protein K492DRAFT_204652 [Lichtheimia hyalospora FSU 10163]|nr:hypothetical protein K492DRAFT_204652 [Lichtheimia hyalospora FSU 10163]
MFTNLVSNIREKLGKKEDEGGIGQHQQRPSIMVEQSTAKNDNGRLSIDEHTSDGLWRRASDGQLYDKSRLSPASRAQPIPVQQRRRATFYGISNVSADDYMQKDLISGSWS